MNKILIIDDERSSHVMTSEVLKQSIPNCRMLSAKSGAEGIKLAKAEQPDTILLDVVMPEMNGYEVCEILKADEQTNSIPIILVSIFQKDTSSRVLGLKSGADVFLSKPFDPTELSAQVSSMLRIRKAEKDLRESEEKYSTIVENSHNAIYIYKNGKFLFVNDKTCEYSGYSKSELYGMKIWDLIHPDDRERVEGYGRKRYGGEEAPKKYSARVVVRNGDVRNCDFAVSTIPYKGDFAILGTINDVTGRKKAEQALKQHARQLQERNEDLDAFSHTVAHNLKNPLGAIIGFVDLLNEDYNQLSKNEINDCISYISLGSNKMLQIINSLLLLASVRKAEIYTEKLNMGHIVAETIKRLTPMIEENKAEIIFPEKWPVAMGYPPWIEEVWVNYLSNAIKYGGPSPQIEIGADTGKYENVPEGSVRFWVKDKGPGISAENQKLFFNIFERLDQVKTEGHGLGLSIVRRIIEKLGGKVGVKSEVGKGSEFYFALPETT